MVVAKSFNINKGQAYTLPLTKVNKMNKKLAEKHFSLLYDNWISEEQKSYEEYFGDENVDKIPTSKLKESNYKDLRVIKDFFEENN